MPSRHTRPSTHAPSPPSSTRRRDFLATLGAGALAAGLPMVPKVALAAGAGRLAPPDAPIARVGIYPAIGICRVGGSRQWFLAPEVPGLPPNPPGGFKDGEQAIKKQVQRFRVYAFDAHGNVIRELTAADARIDWQVHVANTKAAWYGFNNPLDNGDLAPGLPGQLRNAYFVSDAEREQQLIIDGGPCAIAGAGVNPDGTAARYAMGGRVFQKVHVGLGHLRTDDQGRLLVFPPDGISGSPDGAPITSFADNDGWYDDWCDGPVRATVSLPDGRVLTADPAWVAAVGPDFAPEIPPITSLYDVVMNLNVQQGWTPAPAGPLSFRQHIYPTFRRLALMEWVAAESYLRRGWLEVGDFSDPTFIEQLASPAVSAKALREAVFSKFRNPHNLGPTAYLEERDKLPYMTGDGVNYNGSPLQWFQFPALQYAYLKAWAEGNFVNDLHDADLDAVQGLDDLPLAQQPAALTRAALEPCSGGAFHPGVELSYYMRLAPLYARAHDATAEPFRIAQGNRPSLLHNVGRLLTPEVAMQGGNGAPAPIGPQMPGDLTRWMGLPWQCDAFSCQQVVMQQDFPTATWWPALLPVDVLTEVYYQQLMRTDLAAAERLKFFHARVPWSRGVPGIGYHANASYWDGITNMIRVWERMGFLQGRPAPSAPGRPEGLPDTLYVEVGRAATMEHRYPWKPADGQFPR